MFPVRHSDPSVTDVSSEHQHTKNLLISNLLIRNLKIGSPTVENLFRFLIDRNLNGFLSIRNRLIGSLIVKNLIIDQIVGGGWSLRDRKL